MRSGTGNVVEARIRVPSWLQRLSLGLMAVLLLVVCFLLLAYAAAGPGDNLAGILPILAGILALPLVLALALWLAGFGLRYRAPRVAVSLVIASSLASGVGVLLVALWVLLSIGS